MGREEDIREEIRNAELKRDRNLLMLGLSFGLVILFYAFSLINLYISFDMQGESIAKIIDICLGVFSLIVLLIVGNKFINKYFSSRVSK